jgi:hypothetical protein
VDFSSVSEKLLPISKVINARQKLVTGSVMFKKSVGIKCIIPGFNNRPATRYPTILGKPDFSAKTERKYPTSNMMPK